MDSFFLFLVKFVCHQLDERSFFIAGHKLPLCARCTGIYIGIFSSYVYLFVSKKFLGNKPISAIQGVVIVLLMAPLAFDGVSSYLFLRDTTNVIRIITGILFGIGLPVFYVMLYNFNPYTENNRHVIKHTYEFLYIILIAAFISIFILLDNSIIWFFISVILCVSVYASFLSIFFIIRKVLIRIF